MGFPLKDLIYDVGGGILDGRELKARHPRRFVVSGLHRRRSGEGQHGFRLGARGRLVDGHGGRDGDARGHLHGRGAANRRAFLPSRIVRPMHAVPRGHRLDRKAAHRLGGGTRQTWRTSSGCISVATNMEGNTICVLADSLSMPVKSFIPKYQRRVRGARAAGPLPVQGIRAPLRAGGLTAIAHGV